jgi:FimV-like protein
MHMDSLEYIDSYFKGEISPEEAGQFDKKILDDPEFAGEVAFYLNAFVAGKEQLLKERKERFRELYQEGIGSSSQPAVIRKLVFRKTWPRLAAAALLAGIVIGLFMFFRPASQQQLAEQYIKDKLQTMSVTMGKMDSVQYGISLYNEGKYEQALQVFEKIILSDPNNSTAIQKAGIISLRLQDYNKALGYFKKLETFTTLHSNPAVFYEALTLMRRGRSGDAEKANQLLEQVVENDQEMKQEAQEFLKKL